MLQATATRAAAALSAYPTLKATYTSLPEGDAGVEKTIAVMWRDVNGQEGALNPNIYALARMITQNVASRDHAGEVAACLEWVKRNIKFRGEPDEVVQTPLVTLQLSAGDCDDFSVLLAALLRSLGYEVRFRTVAADRGAPADFSHVYVEVLLEGQWTPLDATVPGATLGWAPPDVFRSKAWGMSGIARGSVRGLSGLRGMGMPTPKGFRGLGLSVQSSPAPCPVGYSVADDANGTCIPPNLFASSAANAINDLAAALATRVAGPNAANLQFTAPGVQFSAGQNTGWPLALALGGAAVLLLFVISRSGR